jgi:hypothetical protein
VAYLLKARNVETAVASEWLWNSIRFQATVMKQTTEQHLLQSPSRVTLILFDNTLPL